MACVVVGDAVVAAHLLHVGRAVHLGARGVLRRAKRPLHRSHPLVPGQWITEIQTIFYDQRFKSISLLIRTRR